MNWVNRWAVSCATCISSLPLGCIWISWNYRMLDVTSFMHTSCGQNNLHIYCTSSCIKDTTFDYSIFWSGLHLCPAAPISHPGSFYMLNCADEPCWWSIVNVQILVICISEFLSRTNVQCFTTMATSNLAVKDPDRHPLWRSFDSPTGLHTSAIAAHESEYWSVGVCMTASAKGLLISLIQASLHTFYFSSDYMLTQYMIDLKLVAYFGQTHFTNLGDR